MKNLNISYLTWVLTLIIFIECNSIVNAQWSDNPSENFAVCQSAGTQSNSLISGTSNGGCYITWLNKTNAGAELRIQRLSASGQKQFEENGIIIANIKINPSYLIDYNFIVDNEDNAVVTFLDSTESGKYTLIAKKIDVSGNFIWTNDGIDLDYSDNLKSSINIVETSRSNILVVWNSEDANIPVIHLQKLSPSGVKLWGDLPKVYTHSTEGGYYRLSGLAASENEAVIVVYSTVTGLLPYTSIHIYAQKFNEDGSVLWGEDGLIVQDLGVIAFQMHFDVIPDNEGGVVISWSDDRDFNKFDDSYTQRILSNGTLAFPPNGIAVSINKSFNHFYPTASLLNGDDNIYIFWTEMNEDQNIKGIYGQKLSVSGERLWGDNGKEIVTMAEQTISKPVVISHDSLFYLFYTKDSLNLNYIPQKTKINSLLIDNTGKTLWENSFRTVSCRNSLKQKCDYNIDSTGSVIVCWTDYVKDNEDETDVYAQKINLDGSLGNKVSGINEEKDRT